MSNSTSAASNAPKQQRKPLPQVGKPGPIPVEQEEGYIQHVWNTTYSSCLATLLGSRIINTPDNDKFLVRDIHKSLELADIAREAARSYIDQRKKEAILDAKKRDGDPLNSLLSNEQP